jgi:hypothetical protein
LLLAFAKNRQQRVYTIDHHLLPGGDLPVSQPQFSTEQMFPAPLEHLYQNSLQLRIPCNQLTGDFYSNVVT